jgi:multiple sugar transport system substrate-binding protein
MATAAAGALTEPMLFDWAKAWAQTAPWKPERGAQLSMLRWQSFVQTEDNAFVAIVDAFTKATGVKVTVSRESIDDVQPKASVAANTGSGPDLFWGYYSLPHLFPKKCVDLTDVADYLGKKYGGWVPSAIIYGKGTENKWIDIGPTIPSQSTFPRKATRPRGTSQRIWVTPIGRSGRSESRRNWVKLCPSWR